MHILHHPPVPDADVDVLLGEPKAAIRKMFAPILIALLVIQLNVFVDNMWCSSLGVEAVSAISVVMTIYYFFSHSSAGLGIGINVVISNNLGLGKKDIAGKCAVQLLCLVTLIGLLLMPVMFFLMDDLITAIGGDSIRDLCREYLIPMFIMSPFILLSGIISGMLRGEGAARKSTTLNLVTAFTNIILDPVFIFGMGMGVAGASVATGLSCVVSVSLGLWFYLSGRTFVHLSFEHFRFNAGLLKDTLYVGIPQMLEQNIGSITNLCLVLIIVGCGGSLGLTLYNLPWKVVHFVLVPVSAFSAAMIPVVSASRGQGDAEKMKAASLYALRMAVLIGLAVTAIVVIAADPIMMLFSYSGDMVQYRSELVRIMWIYSPFLIFFGMISYCSSLLSALKKSSISAITVFVRNIIFLAIIYVCGQHNMDWVYWGVTVSEIIGGLLMMVIALHEFRVRYRAMTCPIHSGLSGI